MYFDIKKFFKFFCLKFKNEPKNISQTTAARLGGIFNNIFYLRVYADKRIIPMTNQKAGNRP